MFEGFVEGTVSCGGQDIFVRHNGAADKPPLLMLHGYPQTSAMWHGVVPYLTDHYHILCPDLRGYGRSAKPASDPAHLTYSKRAMAGDFAHLLDQFDIDSAFVASHDRGARVAHRLGLDHPDRIRALAVMDIAPTREMYAGTTDAFARAYWHWFYLIRPAPEPERMIGADARAFWLGKCGGMTGGQMPFHPDALEEYLSCFEMPEAIHATCEDYRAAATIDIAHDDEGGMLEMPVLALWAAGGVVARCFDPLALWQQRATQVTGATMPGTHYFAEEYPEETARHLAKFFAKHGGPTV